jgi:hypothetical protein
LRKKNTQTNFHDQRNFRNTFQNLSNKILLDISNNKLSVKKSPEIGWLKKLYPDIKDFALPFPKVQGLNSAWQWYEKGVFIPILKTKIYPYYGTYFPTRFEHLELFEEWLLNYEGEKNSAIDIGIGSGILSFLMANHNFKNITGTDTNPNSIIGIKEFIAKNPEYSNINLKLGNLFADIDTSTDLIVFNPPWLPSKNEINGLDNAIYYDKNLFSDFFSEAKKHLNTEGKIAILFSNLSQITNLSNTNPIEEEINNGGNFKKDLLIKKSVKPASEKTKRDLNRRADEIVELWILSHK